MHRNPRNRSVQVLSVIGIVVWLTFVAAPNNFAQNKANVVFWSDQPECGNKKLAAENTLKYVCSTAKVTSGTVRIVETDELRLRILPLYYQETVSIRTIIENKSNKKIESDYTNWSIAHYGSESDFISGKVPNAYERYLPPQKRTYVSPSPPTDPFASAPTQTVSKASTNGDARSVTILNPKQQQTVVTPTTGNVGTTGGGSSNQTVSVSRGKTTVWIEDEFIIKRLNVRTVGKNNVVSGTVPFNRYRDSAFKLIFVHVGDTTFVIPFW